MAEVTSGENLTVLILDEDEAEALTELLRKDDSEVLEQLRDAMI
jgi:hypothetical protein